MTTTWTNDRHAAACDAVERLDTATDTELLDAVALRVQWLGEFTDDESKEAARYAIRQALAELSKRFA